MVLRKRLSALIIASVMVLTLSLPVFATEQAQFIGEETIEEIIDIQQSTSLFSLPTNSIRRLWYSNGGISYGYSNNGFTETVGRGSYELTPSTTIENAYHIRTLNGTGSGSFLTKVAANTYYDYSASVNYPMSEYETLSVYGNVQSYMFSTYYATDTETWAKVYPQSVQLLVNGAPYGDIFNYGTLGGYLDCQIELTEDITSLGYRFTYISANSGSAPFSSSVTKTLLYLHMIDNVTFEFEEPPEEDPNTGLLQSLLDWIIGIYNSVFVPDSQKDDADAFQSEVSGTVTEADNVKTELDELEKPEPEEIDTDLSGIISDETYTQQTQIFVDLLKFEKITNMLMIVFTMALISYVLFGKKG